MLSSIYLKRRYTTSFYLTGSECGVELVSFSSRRRTSRRCRRPRHVIHTATSFLANYVKQNKDRFVLSATEMLPRDYSFVQYVAYTDTSWVLLYIYMYGAVRVWLGPENGVEIFTLLMNNWIIRQVLTQSDAR